MHGYCVLKGCFQFYVLYSEQSTLITQNDSKCAFYPRHKSPITLIQGILGLSVLLSDEFPSSLLLNFFRFQDPYRSVMDCYIGILLWSFELYSFLGKKVSVPKSDN